LIAGSLTTTKRQGWRWAPDGAVPAVRMASSIISRGTGSGEKNRTLRRRLISA
jgi:hypothetical protein